MRQRRGSKLALMWWSLSFAVRSPASLASSKSDERSDELSVGARSARAKRVCSEVARMRWGESEARSEGRAVVADLELHHNSVPGNIRCLSRLYEILGEHEKALDTTSWILNQPWCFGEPERLELDPDKSKVPSRCFASTMSSRIQAMLMLGRDDDAQAEFEAATTFEIAGRPAVHWSTRHQLAPYCIPGITARPNWNPEGLPLAEVLANNHQSIMADIDSSLAREGGGALGVSGGPWQYTGITPEIISAGDWTTIALLQQRTWDPAGCALAPNTCSLLRARPELISIPRRFHRSDIGKNTSVMFARMPPGTRLRPHTGGHNTFLSYHLGLRGLEGAAFRVAAGEWQSWEPGRVNVFDDSFVHEVQHNGTQDRIVLIAFAWHPDWAVDPPDGTFDNGGSAAARVEL